MRLLLALFIVSNLVGCADLADHGPVSLKTQAQMETLALPKKEFFQRMAKRGPTPTAPVTLPFHMTGAVPVLKAQITQPGLVPMMLDTGASRTVIQAGMAVAKKVPVLRAEDATVELQGVVGREKGRIGLIDPLKLGGWTINSYPCLIRTYENRTSAFRGAGSSTDSLLGFDVALNHCSYLTVDYLKKKATFGFGDRYQAAGKRSSSSPFTVKHSVPFVTLKSGGKSWEAVVDTGSFNGIEINEEVAATLGVQNQGVKIHGLHLMGVGGTVTSGAINMRTVRLKELEMLGHRYRPAEVDISPGPPRVGSYFLKDYRVTFDFRRKLLWLEW